MVELRLNITVHSEKLFASLYYMNFTSTDDGIKLRHAVLNVGFCQIDNIRHRGCSCVCGIDN